MKVLEITSRADFGGGPEHLLQLIRALPPDIEPFVAAPKDRPYWDRYQREVGRGRMVEIPHRAFSLMALLELRAVVRSEGIGLIHSHGKGAGVFSRPLALLTGVPTVHTFHGLHIGDYGLASRLAYLMFERALGRLTTLGICVSPGEHQQLAARGLVAPDRLAVVPNGVVEPGTTGPNVVTPDKLPPTGHTTLRLVTATRFNHQKDPELLQEIVAGLCQTPDLGSVHLEVLGEGEGAEDFRLGIEAIAAEVEHVTVVFRGATTDPRQYLRSANVYLSTSRWEGMPLAVLEAMSEGLAIVATEVVGNTDVVDDGEQGLLYPQGDAAGALDALKRLTDQVFRQELGRGAQERVRREFRAEMMAHRTGAHYRSIANCGPEPELLAGPAKSRHERAGVGNDGGDKTESTLPNFIYIGPPKAGSTWTARLLESHHDVFVTPAKETYYFDRFYHRGLHWYQRFFAEATDESIRAEVCHDYLYSSKVAARIHQDLPDVKLMVCLREHGDWVRSSYRFASRNGKHRGDLADFIDQRPECWQLDYATMLAPFLETFEPERIHLALFDDLRRDPDEFASTLWHFLGIDNIELAAQLRQPINAAAAARSRRLASFTKSAAVLARRVGLAKTVNQIKQIRLVQDALYVPIRQTSEPAEHQEVGHEDAEEEVALESLRAYYAEDRQRLSELIGIDLEQLWVGPGSTPGSGGD